MHIVRINAKTLARDLRQRGFEPLPNALNAGTDLKPAIRREPHKDLLVQRAPLAVRGKTVGGLLGKHGNADTDQASIRLTPLLPRPHGGNVDRVDRHAQELRIVAAVEMLVGDIIVGHLLRADEIGEANLVWLTTDPMRDGIDHPAGALLEGHLRRGHAEDIGPGADPHDEPGDCHEAQEPDQDEGPIGACEEDGAQQPGGGGLADPELGDAGRDAEARVSPAEPVEVRPPRVVEDERRDQRQRRGRSGGAGPEPRPGANQGERQEDERRGLDRRGHDPHRTAGAVPAATHAGKSRHHAQHHQGVVVAAACEVDGEERVPADEGGSARLAPCQDRREDCCHPTYSRPTVG